MADLEENDDTPEVSWAGICTAREVSKQMRARDDVNLRGQDVLFGGLVHDSPPHWGHAPN